MAPNLFEIQEMTMNGIGPIVDRSYRDMSSSMQWARELYKNAEEANATRVLFGVEWQGVESKGVYRRAIADNGDGMTGDELRKFFNTYGGGIKSIGGAHENFGIGAKITLLPWNHQGVVVISRKDNETNMIRIRRREDGAYGLQQYAVRDADGVRFKSTVVPLDNYDQFRGDEDIGIDWCKVLDGYDWIKDHGTVIVLLGNEPNQDTIFGDPIRDKHEVKALTEYLNSRFWEPKLITHVFELADLNKATWPKSKAREHKRRPTASGGTFATYFERAIVGAKHIIATDSAYPVYKMKSGTVLANNDVKLDWYLWNVPYGPGEDTKRTNTGPRYGSISVLYRNELYNVRPSPQAYRSFGISERPVRLNLWLVIRVPEGEPGTDPVGVYPHSTRTTLQWHEKERGNRDLPWEDWEDSFAGNMPAEIIEALKQARPEETTSFNDPKWRERLAARFASRIKMLRYRPEDDGAETSANPSIVARVPGNVTPTDHLGGVITDVWRPRPVTNTRQPVFAVAGNDRPASRTKLRGGFPECRLSNDAESFDEGMAVTWTPPSSANPSGVINIYRHHWMFQRLIEMFQKDYPGHHADKVRDVVEMVYQTSMIVRVANIHGNMPAVIAMERVNDKMLNSEALTSSLFGMWSEDAVIHQELVKTLGRQRQRPRSQIELPAVAVALTAMPATVM